MSNYETSCLRDLLMADGVNQPEVVATFDDLLHFVLESFEVVDDLFLPEAIMIEVDLHQLFRILHEDRRYLGRVLDLGHGELSEPNDTSLRLNQWTSLNFTQSP